MVAIGNLVTIAVRYVADAYHPKEPPYQIWTQYNIRQMSYWYNYLGCYGNVATIATRYVADAYPIEPPYQTWTQLRLNTKELQSNPTNFASLTGSFNL